MRDAAQKIAIPSGSPSLLKLRTQSPYLTCKARFLMPETFFAEKLCHVSCIARYSLLGGGTLQGNKIDGVEAENGGIEDDDESREGRDDDV